MLRGVTKLAPRTSIHREDGAEKRGLGALSMRFTETVDRIGLIVYFESCKRKVLILLYVDELTCWM